LIVNTDLSYDSLPHFTAAKKNSKHGSLKEQISHSANSVSSNSETANVEGVQNDLEASDKRSESLGNIDEGSDLKKAIPKDIDKTCTKEVDEEVVELDNMFFEDSSAWEAVAPEILKQQQIEKLSHDGYGHLLGNIDDIWKKVQVPFYFFFILTGHVSCLICASAMHYFLTVLLFCSTTGRFW
jgi:Zn-dependent oligopeptidase